MNYERRCLIVPAAHVEFARQLCIDIAGQTGAGMFIAPCSATGEGPPTHYLTEGCIAAEFAALLDAGPAAIYAVCQQKGLPHTLADITALLAESDLSSESNFTAMARLGLNLILEPV